MLTMAAMLLLYAASEAIHSSGIFAVLVFGMAMTNAESIMKKMPARYREDWDATDFALHETIGWFHEEVTFIARVFFFVYLGMLLDVSGFIFPVIGHHMNTSSGSAECASVRTGRTGGIGRA